jgi:hypothetical protein
MTLGANDKKKLIFLCILGALALYLVYSNLIAGPDVPRSAQPRASAPAAAPGPVSMPARAEAPAAKRAPSNRGRSEELHLVYIAKRPEDRPDLTNVDPTVRWDLLAKVQEVPPAGAGRNLFQFGQAPPKVAEAKPAGPEPKVFIPVGPKAPAPVVAKEKPPEPPPPPLPWKFYGISSVRDNGRKTAYFLDGDEILHASEGDMLKRRYKILRIGPNSVVVEDTDSKRQQTVPLTEESQS